MEIKVICTDLTKYACDAVIVNLFEGVSSPGGATGAADHALGGLITQLIKDGEITGTLNQVCVIHTQGKLAAKRCVIVGLGKPADFKYDRIRQVSAEALKALRKIGAKQVATVIHGAGVGGLDVKLATGALVEGAILGLYRFGKYIREKSPDIDELAILEQDKNKIKDAQDGAERGKILADATNLARDLINEPANCLTPEELVTRAKEIARKGNLECQVFDKAKMRELGMGAILSISEGSDKGAFLVVLKYHGGASKNTIGLVGKGVTFDSGGLSIKPAASMETMKTDMSGAAAVLATMDAVSQLKPKINVCAIISALENMPSGHAARPGDVVAAMNGKTIEVITTDAEGRMILADAICYAKKLNLSPIIDIASLTGSCGQALGSLASGLFGNDNALMDRIKSAAQASGERLWQLPMFDEYNELLQSNVADIKNVGGRDAGATLGALFLEFFVEDTPWVHLDFGRTSFEEKEKPYQPKGARGALVRTLVNFLLGERQ
ncbi:MAG: leucyl aminopeptidase [Candidatus Omnitrophota bacterium]